MKLTFRATKLKRFILLTMATCLLLLTPLVGLSISSSSKVYASDDLYDDLDRLERELAEIKRQMVDLQSKIDGEKNLQNSLSIQIYELANSISQLELGIKEKELDIEKKETKIKILEEEITDARKQIESIENNVFTLEATANDILKTIYVDSKTNTMIDILLTSTESQSFVSNIQYHTALGARDQNTLEQLQVDKLLLEEQKKKLEEDKIEIEKLAEQIIEQKEDLEKDQEQMSSQVAQKNKLLQDSQLAAEYFGSMYYNLTDDEMKKEAEMDYIIQQIAFQGTKPDGYVVKGQIIGTEGMNGCATGPHTHFGYAPSPSVYPPQSTDWRNPCNYLPYKYFYENWHNAFGSCSGDSTLRWPNNEYFSSSRGYAWYHMGIDLNAGTNKYIYAAHDGYYFEEVSACSSSWCSYGCHGNQTCIRICENTDCKNGKVSIYCHLNFI